MKVVRVDRLSRYGRARGLFNKEDQNGNECSLTWVGMHLLRIVEKNLFKRDRESNLCYACF